jgi:hypothetical protein
MVSDLKNDVTMYQSFDSLNLHYCDMIDSVFLLMKNKEANAGRIYYLARRLTMMGSFAPSINEKTYMQMTSTGAFRIIKHRAVADSIALYYQLIKSFDYWSELQRTRVNNLIDNNNKLFSAESFLAVYKAIEMGPDSVNSFIKSNPAFMSKDPQDINTVLMHYQYFYGFHKLMNTRTSNALIQSKKLIALLQKEYKLEDE